MADSPAAQSASLPQISLASTIDIDNPPMGVFSNDWYVLMLKGQKSGHMRSTMERVQRDGQDDVICSSVSMVIEIGRAGSQIRITMDQTTEETIAGEPIRFESRTALGKIPSSVVGEIKDGKVTVKTTQFGLTTKQTHKLPDGAIMSWGTYREQMKHGLHVGLKYELPLYDPTTDMKAIIPTTFEVFEPEPIDLFGRAVTAYRTQQTMRLKGLFGRETKLESTAWVTDASAVVKMHMNVPGLDIPFEVIATTRAVALAPNEPTELMVDTLIQIDRPLDRNSQSISYRLINKNRDGIHLPETSMQKGIKAQDGTAILEVTRLSARREANGNSDHKATVDGKVGEPEDLSLYLQATPELNIDDPLIQELAKKAADGEKNPAKLADKLCQFVYDYIENRDLSVGFATASEVARSRQGDCTEFSVLLAALGRANKIPSRLVTGVMYADKFAGKKNVFVGHMWTQLWIDGQWVDVDAAHNQTDVDPTHIAFAFYAAETNSLAELATSGWMSLSKTKLEIVDVK